MQEKVEIITNNFEQFWNYWTKILKNGYCDKGQIISEQICGVLKFSKKKQRNVARISALA